MNIEHKEVILKLQELEDKLTKLQKIVPQTTEAYFIGYREALDDFTKDLNNLKKDLNEILVNSTTTSL